MAQIVPVGKLLSDRRNAAAAERRLLKDWARRFRGMLQQRYLGAERVGLVTHNLNTHGSKSLSETCPAAEAKVLAECLEIHHPPKRGSRLSFAEIDLTAPRLRLMLEPLHPCPRHPRKAAEFMSETLEVT